MYVKLQLQKMKKQNKKYEIRKDYMRIKVTLLLKKNAKSKVIFSCVKYETYLKKSKILHCNVYIFEKTLHCLIGLVKTTRTLRAS